MKRTQMKSPPQLLKRKFNLETILIEIKYNTAFQTINNSRRNSKQTFIKFHDKLKGHLSKPTSHCDFCLFSLHEFLMKREHDLTIHFALSNISNSVNIRKHSENPLETKKQLILKLIVITTLCFQA